MSEIGIDLSGGHALEPEQSTAAIVAHHPQAVYFGMKSGFIPAEKKGDELIAGTDRGGELPPEDDPEGDGTIEAEADDPRWTRRPPEGRAGYGWRLSKGELLVPGRSNSPLGRA